MNKFDFAILVSLGGILIFYHTFKKYRRRSFNDSFTISLCGASYMLVVTSLIELIYTLPESLSNNLNDTSLAKNATVLFFSSIIFFITAKDSLTHNKRGKIQDLGIPEEVSQKLNHDGIEKLLAYANDLIASGLYTTSHPKKEKCDCGTIPIDNKTSQAKQYRIKVIKDGIVNHYDIAVEEVTHRNLAKSLSKGFFSVYPYILKVSAFIYLGFSLLFVVISPEYSGYDFITQGSEIFSIGALGILLTPHIVRFFDKRKTHKDSHIFLVSLVFTILYMSLSFKCLGDAFDLTESLSHYATALGLSISLIINAFDTKPNPS